MISAGDFTTGKFQPMMPAGTGVSAQPFDFGSYDWFQSAAPDNFVMAALPSNDDADRPDWRFGKPAYAVGITLGGGAASRIEIFLETLRKPGALETLIAEADQVQIPLGTDLLEIARSNVISAPERAELGRLLANGKQADAAARLGMDANRIETSLINWRIYRALLGEFMHKRDRLGSLTQGTQAYNEAISQIKRSDTLSRLAAIRKLRDFNAVLRAASEAPSTSGMMASAIESGSLRIPTYSPPAGAPVYTDLLDAGSNPHQLLARAAEEARLEYIVPQPGEEGMLRRRGTGSSGTDGDATRAARPSPSRNTPRPAAPPRLPASAAAPDAPVSLTNIREPGLPLAKTQLAPSPVAGAAADVVDTSFELRMSAASPQTGGRAVTVFGMASMFFGGLLLIWQGYNAYEDAEARDIKVARDDVGPAEKNASDNKVTAAEVGFGTGVLAFVGGAFSLLAKALGWGALAAGGATVGTVASVAGLATVPAYLIYKGKEDDELNERVSELLAIELQANDLDALGRRAHGQAPDPLTSIAVLIALGKLAARNPGLMGNSAFWSNPDYRFRDMLNLMIARLSGSEGLDRPSNYETSDEMIAWSLLLAYHSDSGHFAIVKERAGFMRQDGGINCTFPKFDALRDRFGLASIPQSQSLCDVVAIGKETTRPAVASPAPVVTPLRVPAETHAAGSPAVPMPQNLVQRDDPASRQLPRPPLAVGHETGAAAIAPPLPPHQEAPPAAPSDPAPMIVTVPMAPAVKLHAASPDAGRPIIVPHEVPRPAHRPPDMLEEEPEEGEDEEGYDF